MIPGGQLIRRGEFGSIVTFTCGGNVRRDQIGDDAYSGEMRISWS
jgi:hypothetical protein